MTSCPYCVVSGMLVTQEALVQKWEEEKLPCLAKNHINIVNDLKITLAKHPECECGTFEPVLMWP